MGVKRPTTVRVGPFDYTIEFDQALVDARLTKGAYGCTEHRELRISIGGAMALQQEKDTVLHEVLHAVVSVAWLDEDYDREEATIRRLTPVLLGVLQSNPELVRYLVKP